MNTEHINKYIVSIDSLNKLSTGLNMKGKQVEKKLLLKTVKTLVKNICKKTEKIIDIYAPWCKHVFIRFTLHSVTILPYTHHMD